MLHGVYTSIRKRLSWSVQISLLLVLAAIFPLVITISGIEMQTRPALISQASATMETQAQTQVHLIDVYLVQHIQDIQTLSQLAAVQKFLGGDDTFTQETIDELMASLHLDTNYDSWSLFDLQGKLRLFYPTVPQQHGQYSILPDDLRRLRTSSRVLISDVFYNAIKDELSVDLYARVVSPDFHVLGFVRATLGLRHIWNMVDNVPCAASSQENCYAFILDQYGVRIAYTNPDPSGFTHPAALFSAIAPLSPAVMQLIRREDLYGVGEQPVKALYDKTLAQIQRTQQAASPRTGASPVPTFQIIPAGQSETFQAAMATSVVVPWTYFLLKPLSKVTLIADQQLLRTCIVAAIVLILVIIIGALLGKNISSRILYALKQERRAHEQQQRLVQLKDQFILNVSHELRTPLTEVYGYLELLALDGSRLDTPTQTSFLNHAIHGCEELQLLVSNILDTMNSDSQFRSPQVQNIFLAQTVKDVLELFSPLTLQDYEIHICVPETLALKADQQYVRQILRNLLSNAFKYSPTRTEVTVSASVITESVAKAAPSPFVCICVKDRGSGIAPADIPLLFEKFVRLRRHISGPVRGTGLGLYISKHLVEAMGGRIWVESSGIAGQGSTFSFTLPCAIDGEEAAAVDKEEGH